MNHWSIVRIGAPVAVVLLAAFLFLKSQAHDSKLLHDSWSALLRADVELKMYGAFTNHNPDVVVELTTNQIEVSGSRFNARMTARGLPLNDFGYMVLTDDRSVIWVDKKYGAEVYESPSQHIKTPKRFRSILD